MILQHIRCTRDVCDSRDQGNIAATFESLTQGKVASFVNSDMTTHLDRVIGRLVQCGTALQQTRVHVETDLNREKAMALAQAQEKAIGSHSGSREKAMAHAFHSIDRDGSGFIEFQELRSLACTTSPHANAQEVSSLLLRLLSHGSSHLVSSKCSPAFLRSLKAWHMAAGTTALALQWQCQGTRSVSCLCCHRQCQSDEQESLWAGTM
jgi:hypothetical protein